MNHHHHHGGPFLVVGDFLKSKVYYTIRRRKTNACLDSHKLIWYSSACSRFYFSSSMWPTGLQYTGGGGGTAQLSTEIENISIQRYSSWATLIVMTLQRNYSYIKVKSEGKIQFVCGGDSLTISHNIQIIEQRELSLSSLTKY